MGIQNNVVSLHPQTMNCMGKLELVIESDNVSIYSPKYDGETQTEFEKFMSDNGSLPQLQLKKDFDAIMVVIKKMVKIAGLVRIFFVWKGRISKRFRYLLNKDEEGESELSDYIVSGFRRGFLLLAMEGSRRLENTKMIPFCWI